MDNKEKKEYGGCLSILLPLWIIGQILSLIINAAGFAAFFTEFPLSPILLIGANIVALIGIIFLLQFKKIGFYIFILTFFLMLLVGFLYPDYVDSHIIFKSIFGLGLFLILMSIKNKETGLNGYQTLGIFKSPQNTEDHVLQEQVTKDNEESKTNNEIIVTDRLIEEAKTNEDDNQVISTPFIKEEQKTAVDHNSTNPNPDSPHKTRKFFYIISFLLVLSIMVAVVLIVKDNRSDQEVYNDAISLIKTKDYKKGIKELNNIKDDYVQAKSLLGKLYYYNDTVGINKELGEKLLWEAFEKNDLNACRTLWDIYYNEKGKWDTLYKISTKVSEIDDTIGNRLLANIYFVNEIGGKKNTKQDYKKVEFHALKIAENDPFASFYLGQIYSEGGYGIEKNDIKAFYWWNNGAKLGDTDCYDNLGWSYYYGNGVNQNFKKAYDSFKKAIEIYPKDNYAHYYIALLFKYGQYVKADRDSLKYYLEKAKELGNEDALIMYENEF